MSTLPFSSYLPKYCYLEIKSSIHVLLCGSCSIEKETLSIVTGPHKFAVPLSNIKECIFLSNKNMVECYKIILVDQQELFLCFSI